MNVPFIGKLFSQETKDIFRTELIVTVSPRVVENQHEMRKVTDELQRRMQKASEYQKSIELAATGS